jgi:prephenate dehydratase
MQLDNCSQIITLGPKGTFSDEAAKKIRGEGVIVSYTGTFAEALFRVTEEPDSIAVVPIENSVAGTVAQVQDSLVNNKLVILGEINLLIEYSLLANVAPENVKLCYAHPQALEQSSKFLSKNLTASQNQLTRSNVDSGIQFLEAIKSDKKALAAIVPASFADSYPEWKVASGIQDYHNNTTRFLIVRPRRENEEHDFLRKKTSLYVEFQEDRSGLLYELLSVFNLFQINLCRLESRPAKDTPWAYVFYVDFYNTEHTKACLDAMQVTKFNYKVIGSYDLVDRLA